MMVTTGNNRFKKWITLLCVTALLFTGCSAQKEEKQEGQAGNDGKKEETGAENEETGEKSMGRYIESEIELPEEITTMNEFPTAYLQMLEDGRPELVELLAGKYISEDNGETWKAESAPWLYEVTHNSYIEDIALAPDGSMAIIHDPYEEDSDKEDSGTDEMQEQEEGAEEERESLFSPEYLYADADGNTTPFTFENGEDDYVHLFCFDKESRLYAFTMSHGAYEINPEENSAKKLFDMESLADTVCCTEKYMIAMSSKEIAIYDLEEGMLAEEDTVFQDFIMENLGNEIGNNSDGHSVIMAEGEQPNIIYFACESGLYRHVIGGTAMEQIVDGAISSLGDPMMILESMITLPDNEFLILYNDAKLYRYRYDPDIPTVPEEQIRVYSLDENYSMKQAVSLFQKQNPKVYVRYEIGMTGEDGMTREDAVKNLNTRMMSEEGPDILVLDGLPENSYREKGVLADVSGIAESMSGEEGLFPNIVEASRRDGKIYSLPMRFQLPMIAGDEEAVQSVTDLETLAQTMETLRQENPQGGLIGLKTAQEMLYTLGQVSSAAWTKQDGTIDEKALEEFLTAADRIYQAEIAGYDSEYLQEYEENMMQYLGELTGEGRFYATASNNAIEVAMGEQKIAVGKVYRTDFDFNMITTLAGQEENFGYGSWNGQVAKGFIPNCTVGVFANSAEKETVMKFYRFLFERELQDLDLSGGFPVNQASFDTFAKSPRPEEFGGGGIAISDDDGDKFSLDIKWAGTEDFGRLKEMAKSAEKSCIGDATIEAVVYEVGEKVLNQRMSVQEGVKEIVKKAAIYLAE